MGDREQRELVKVESTELTSPSGEEEIYRLRAEIEMQRTRVRDSLGDLQTEFEETIDWRRWVREHPWQTVGVSFAIGYLWGSG